MSEITDHLKQVSDWLDKNVSSYPTPSILVFSDFEFDWGKMTGRFYLALDDQRIPDAFSLSLGSNGWIQHHPPMFYSPLGAPASYGSVDLTDETIQAIANALKIIFPKLKPLGLDAETGELIIGRTPLEKRINDIYEFAEVKSKVSNSGFSFTYSVVN